MSPETGAFFSFFSAAGAFPAGAFPPVEAEEAGFFSAFGGMLKLDWLVWLSGPSGVCERVGEEEERKATRRMVWFIYDASRKAGGTEVRAGEQQQGGGEGKALGPFGREAFGRERGIPVGD